VSRFTRLGAIALALAAACCLALAVQGGRWWLIGDDVAIGPVSTEHCFGGTCQRGDLTWANGGDTWLRAGVAAYGGGLIAAAVLVALAGALAARRSGRLVAGVSAVAAVTALVPGAIFLATFPGVDGAVLGRGIWLFGAGLAAAIAAAVLVLSRRSAPPLDPAQDRPRAA